MASISAIRAINHREATKLRKRTIELNNGRAALLMQAASRKGRAAVSDRTGIPTSDLLRWAHQADVMRINGIGSEYAELLSTAGVDTIKSLRRRNAANLMVSMTQANAKRRLVQRLPTTEMVQGWIDEANAMEPIVTS